ncbi:hypothetical protein CSW77_26215, partial [Shigella flexneri]
LYNLRGNGAKDHDRRNASIIEVGRDDRKVLEGVDVLGGEDGFCRSRQDAIAFALFSHETKLELNVR